MPEPGAVLTVDSGWATLTISYIDIRFKLPDRRGDEGGGRYRENGEAGQVVSGSGSKQVGSNRSSD